MQGLRGHLSKLRGKKATGGLEQRVRSLNGIPLVALWRIDCRAATLQGNQKAMIVSKQETMEPGTKRIGSPGEKQLSSGHFGKSVLWGGVSGALCFMGSDCDGHDSPETLR